MATKNYMINDKWLDLDKQNIVELQSVDGELDSMKVNGSEIVTPSGKITITENGTDIDVAQYALADVAVEGGGGSSDLSTAEVTVNNSASNTNIDFTGVMLENDELVSASESLSEATIVLTVVLYKNIQHVYINADSVTSISGNITGDMADGFDVTGDCVINAVGYSDIWS